MTERSDKFVSGTAGSIKVDNAGATGESFDLDGEISDEVAASLAAREPDAIDGMIDEALGDWADPTGPMIDAFDELIAAATSMEEVRELLAIRAGDAIAGMDVAAIVEMGERLGFAAKIAGLVEKPGE